MFTKKNIVILATAFFVALIAFQALAPRVFAQSTPPSPGLGDYNTRFQQLMQDLKSSGKITNQQYQDFTSNDPLLGVLAIPLKGIILLIQGIAGLILWLGANLITFLFQFNTYITQLPAVQTGWQVSRDIANLGFVLALVIMAFMTILRINQYGAQKMLPKLIAAAIVVNFSLTIGGAILDFTNVVTKFFVDRSVGNSTSLVNGQQYDMGTAIVSALNPQAWLSVDTTTIAKATQDGTTGSSVMMDLISVFTVAAFTFLMALVLLATALMLLTRFVYLTLLMAVAPFPWLFGILPIPILQSTGRQWWQKFMEWAFVAPFLSFFLYLTLRTAVTIQNLSKSLLNADANVKFTYITGFVVQATNALVLCGFLVGGLIASNRMGVWGGSALLGVAKKTGEKAKSLAKGATVGAAGAGLSALGKRAATWGATKDKEGKGRSRFEQWAESGAARIPFLGAALTGMASVSANTKEKIKKESQEGIAKNKKYSKDTLANKLERQMVSLTADDIPTALALAEKGGLNKLSSGKRGQLKNMVNRYGLQKDFAKYDPVLAADADTDPGTTREQKMHKYTAMMEDVTKLDPETIKNQHLAEYMTPWQKSQIAIKGTYEQQNAIPESYEDRFVSDGKGGGLNQEGVTEAFQKLGEAEAKLDKNLSELKEAKDSGSTQEVEALSRTRIELKASIKEMTDRLVHSGNPSEEIQEKRKTAVRDLGQLKKQPAWQAFFQKKYKAEVERTGGEEGTQNPAGGNEPFEEAGFGD